jgi:hypothetical protein
VAQAAVPARDGRHEARRRKNVTQARRASAVTGALVTVDGGATAVDLPTTAFDPPDGAVQLSCRMAVFCASPAMSSQW